MADTFGEVRFCKELYLFRGKRPDNGEWVEGDLFHNDNAGFPMVLIGHVIMSRDKHTNALSYDGFDLREVDPETVGRFTGLLVNKRKWFEHDIVSVRSEDGSEVYRFIIAFGTCGGVKNVSHEVGYVGFHFIPANKETARCMEFGARDDLLYWAKAYRCEVVGNVHDNPECLD